MSSKQLARTVIDGRRITLHVPGFEGPINGYLCGMDDFHWMVVTSVGEKYLVHKASASAIHIADESTYDSERCRGTLECVVGPFRRFVEAEFFGRQGAPASEMEPANA